MKSRDFNKDSVRHFLKPWDRFKDLLNKCPHHGFSPLHQIDTFYNSLNQSEQDSLNSAANGNFLTNNTQEALTIIENKSKVETSRSKPQVISASGSSTQDAHVCFRATSFLTLGKILKLSPHRVTLAGPSVLPHPLSSSKEGWGREPIYHGTRNCDPQKGYLKKLGDTERFLIPCDFYGLESCMALADLVDYDVDPRVPLILGRPFLRTTHALVYVHGEELTLRVGDEKLVFNIESTLKYPRKHGDESIHKINILDITCEDLFHEVLNVQKSNNPMSGSPTSSSDPMKISLIEELLNNEILNDLPPPLPVYEINETKKIKISIDDPPDLELKDLPPHLEYAFLEGTSKLPVIIAKDLKREEKEQLLKIFMEDDFKPDVQHQRRVNPKIHEVIKAEVIKLLDARLIYLISDSPWQEKTTFTCPFGTFAYRRMPFGLCNAHGTFQRCMVAIFHFMIEKTIEVFMDDFLVFWDSFSSCLSHLDMILKWCEDTNLVLNWEKCHFMVKEGIVLGHKISKSGIKVDRAKMDVIAKLPPSTTVKGIRSFLGHASFYRRFIKDFSKIARPMTHLLEKDTPFFFSDKCLSSFKILKKKLTKAPILIHNKKGAENLAADHLSRLENPHQWDLVGMEMNDNFPHESLNMISIIPEKPAPFCRYCKLPSGNVLIKGILFGHDVWTGMKLWIFSRLATMVTSGDIMARTTPPRKFLTLVFSGPQYIAMPMNLSHTVTHVNVREKSHRGTKCPKILFRIVRSLTSGASAIIARSRSRCTNLYTISIDDMMKSSPICLLSKASKSKSWLWHRRLNHLNFGTINDLARKDLVRGLPRLKFEKDHLCSACQLGKSKKFSHEPKSENINMEVLHTLHMDLCGLMRVQCIKGKKYILVIVDDYSRFTWAKVGLNKTVRYIRTDNGTEFVNQVMSEYYEGVGVFHQKSVLRTPQQNGVVERRNRTLVEAARTMMIFSKAPMFLWAEAVATACYTQNRSLIHTRHNKTPYELVHDKKPDLTFL
ncbi:reverse transcriptase domain-containing protein [Tanacetum coccineum]